MNPIKLVGADDVRRDKTTGDLVIFFLTANYSPIYFNNALKRLNNPNHWACTVNLSDCKTGEIFDLEFIIDYKLKLDDVRSHVSLVVREFILRCTEWECDDSSGVDWKGFVMLRILNKHDKKQWDFELDDTWEDYGDPFILNVQFYEAEAKDCFVINELPDLNRRKKK